MATESLFDNAITGILYLISGIVSTGIALVGWLMARLRSLERRQLEVPTRAEVDKLILMATQPVREDVKDLGVKTDKIYELLITQVSEKKK